MLTRRDISSLVIDNLCNQAGRRNTTVACFYFDFATPKEHSPASALGCLLRQLVFGLEEIPEEISRGYKDRKNAIGGQAPQISAILKMLQTTASKKGAFICIDAIDECGDEHRVKLLDSISQLLQKSPGTRIFMTGRSHILPDIEQRLAGKVTSISISSKREDVIRYLRNRLAADTTPDAMDTSLEGDILNKIPSDNAEMYVEAVALRNPSLIIH